MRVSTSNSLSSILILPVFNGIDLDIAQHFFDTTATLITHYKSGDFIAFRGDECRALHVLCKGIVRAVMVNSDGKEVVIEKIEAPAILAPAFLYASQNQFPVDVQVVKPSELLKINKEAFEEWMQHDRHLLDNFLRLISNKAIFLSEKVNNFALNDLRSRLINYLLNEYKGESQQQIADKIGVARPSLSRVLRKLVKTGMIVMEGRRIVIPNAEKLQQAIKIYPTHSGQRQVNFQAGVL